MKRLKAGDRVLLLSAVEDRPYVVRERGWGYVMQPAPPSITPVPLQAAQLVTNAEGSAALVLCLADSGMEVLQPEAQFEVTAEVGHMLEEATDLRSGVHAATSVARGSHSYSPTLPAKGDYIGLRSPWAGGKYLQARRKGAHPCCFYSALFGVWEQWLQVGTACGLGRVRCGTWLQLAAISMITYDDHLCVCMQAAAAHTPPWQDSSRVPVIVLTSRQ